MNATGVGEDLALDPIPHTGAGQSVSHRDWSKSAGGIGLLIGHLQLEMVAR